MLSLFIYYSHGHGGHCSLTHRTHTSRFASVPVSVVSFITYLLWPSSAAGPRCAPRPLLHSTMLPCKSSNPRTWGLARSGHPPVRAVQLNQLFKSCPNKFPLLGTTDWDRETKHARVPAATMAAVPRTSPPGRNHPRDPPSWPHSGATPLSCPQLGAPGDDLSVMHSAVAAARADLRAAARRGTAPAASS